MFSLVASVLCIVGLVLAFTSITWALVPIALGIAAGYSMWFVVKTREFIPHDAELSPVAMEMLHKFGHYYAMPYAGKSLSSSASMLAMAAAVVGIIAAFKTEWWVLAGSVFLYFAGNPVARAFNPGMFLADERERQGHNELIAWITEGRIPEAVPRAGHKDA